MDEVKELKLLCNSIRKDIIKMISGASSGHPGGSLSAVELIAGIYHVMNVNPADPGNPSRDRFVLSKGHAAPCYYAVLGEMGFFDKKEFGNFRQLHSMLQGHPDSRKVPGIDASTGSLGQGISIAVGMALGAKKLGQGIQVYTIVGDGEIQEGLVWEACMAAAKYKLDNLTIVIDNNGLQIDGTNDEVMPLGDLHRKLESFGLNVIELPDGNDVGQVLGSLRLKTIAGMPKCIIAHTTKGKGVSFMENQVGWHGKAPNAEEARQAMDELEKEAV